MIKSNKIIFIIIIFLLVLIFLGLSGFYFYKFQKIKNNPELAKQEEIKAITKKIKEVIDIPVSEEPVLATVIEKEKINKKEFFKNSENGDKILIYSQAKKVILYRPSENKIIELAPLVENIF